MAKNFYDVLWVNKSASAEEIKKAYRKQAMKYHPDRKKDDAQAEAKFKEVNEAYATLSDAEKKKNYDMFGSTKANPFSWWWSSWYSANAWGYWWFEDMFSSSNGWGASFDFSDLFWQWFWSTNKTYAQKEESLDVEHTYEIPIFDLILWCRIEVTGENKKKVKLKIAPNTKPGAKLRVKWLWKNIWWKQGNLIIKIEARMPKNISEVDKSMLEKIRENVWY